MSDSIDAQLLDYYQRELTWLRHAGSQFAERYPKVARRLELSPGECPDPHVERLLEGFALLAARLQRRLDDDYAEFSDALLEQLYPLAMRPLPSCAIVQFEPDPSKGNLDEGYPLPRDTPLFVTTDKGQSIHFRSTAAVHLWPVEVTEALILGSDEAQALTGVAQSRSALRLSLRCLGESQWAGLGIEQLRIHLAASPVINACLYDLLGAHAMQVLAGSPGSVPTPLKGLPQIVGFADDEALLPDEDGVHPGMRLLAEYFAFADKFHFFDLPLHGVTSDSQTLYLYIVFDRAPGSRLHLQASDIALGCAPVINLFPRTSEPLRPDGTHSEYRLIADSHRENSVEIHSIRGMRASSSAGGATLAGLLRQSAQRWRSAALLACTTGQRHDTEPPRQRPVGQRGRHPLRAADGLARLQPHRRTALHQSPPGAKPAGRHTVGIRAPGTGGLGTSAQPAQSTKSATAGR